MQEMRCCFLPHSETVLGLLFQGGGNCNIDEDALITLLNTSSEREATVPSPYHALKFNNVQAEQAKGQKISSLPLAVTNSHHLRTLPCQVKVKAHIYVCKCLIVLDGLWERMPTGDEKSLFLPGSI